MNRTISKALIGFTLFVSCTLLCVVSPSLADYPPYGMPSAIDPSASYLFFFHNYYVETKGTDGDCKYFDILKAFADKGFIVISEIRPKDASVVEYAKKATANIQKLLDAGVPPENITVAGHSKGGVIAIQVASLLEKPKVNYVIMAGCGIAGLEKAYPDFGRLNGNFLSVYATSDKVAGSCSTAFSQAKQDVLIKEIAFENAAGHQLFFKPTDDWFEPVVSWLKH
jgi:predicted esterase